MRKPLIIGLVIIGLVVLAFLYWTISPFFITKRVSENLPIAQTPAEMVSLRQGEFQGIGGHHASGSAKIVAVDGKKYLRFEENFEVTNGPDLLVYLGKNGRYDPKASLGNLKGNVGSQNYEISASTNLTDYDSVWVWCRSFSVAFGVADLK